MPMPERHPLVEKKTSSATGEDHEAFAIACLQRRIERCEALEERCDFAEAIRRLETGAACATLQEAAWALANV